ncbi:MAG: hypothetical protein WKF84_26955 [Pyrinomonadaceae bacterium]
MSNLEKSLPTADQSATTTTTTSSSSSRLASDIVLVRVGLATNAASVLISSPGVLRGGA